MSEQTIVTDIIGGAPRIAVDRCGTGDLLLFLHGIGSNRTNWHDQLVHFGSGWRAAAWDARGYGESDDVPGAVDFAVDFSDDLRRVLDFYRAEKAHLVGLSMGGMIAQCFYFRHPDRVATLTLADTMPGFGSLPAEERQKFIASRREPLMRGLTPRDIAPGAVDALLAADAAPAARATLLASLSALRQEPYLATLDAMVGLDRTGALETIAVPTHFIVGERDTLTPPSVTQAMARAVPGADVTIIPGAGHLTNLEKPEAFNRDLESFLRRVAA